MSQLWSCVSYRRCKEKFSTVVDSVTVMVPVEVRIPKDSLSLRYVTDTLRHTIVERQGRAQVIIRRDSIFTTVKVICKDSTIYIEKEVLVPVTQNYEPNKTPIWVWFALGGAGLLLTLSLIRR